MNPLPDTDAGVDDLSPLVDDATALVAHWLRSAEGRGSRRDRVASRRLSSLVGDEAGLAFTMRFIDRVARPEDDGVAAGQLARLAADGQPPAFLGPFDRLLLTAGARLAPRLPRIVMPLARARMRALVGHLVVDARPRRMRRELARRRGEGFAVNVNLLGEAVLGEGEAQRRLDAVLGLVDLADVDYVSVKVSSLASQLDLWDFDGTVDRIVGRLRVLYRRAGATDPVTFVNLDMEEYRDLGLTVAAFTRLLDEPELRHLDAGIALQAYLPDTFDALTHLAAWAQRRHDRGGGRVKVRLVKGANLAMERVHAAMHGWHPAPYPSKADTDASFTRCLDWVLRPERLRGLRVGVGSHNLFDVAFAHLLARRRGVADDVELEMLQGMAPALAAVVREQTGGMLLYVPVVALEDFDVAIAYLFRRLEENAARGNFLRVAQDLRPGGPDFDTEARRFAVSVADRWRTSTASRRGEVPEPPEDGFGNEPESDPTRPAVLEWARAAVETPFEGVRAPKLTEPSAVDEMLDRARAAQTAWNDRGAVERRTVLHRMADELTARSSALLNAMVHEASKTVAEADPELCEAIDLTRWYADHAVELDRLEGVRFVPHGVVAVVPPWNFPVAIPTGGVAAALAAGNAVLFKPAPETRRVAELAAEAAWAAGVPSEVLQFVHCDDDEVGRRVVTGADAVILTGAWDTARLFRSWKPDMRLFAETSGKNAMVVTSHADLDLAVADLVASAFGHAGQKCSAASLAICVGDVYRSERFRRQLVDAASTLRVGPASRLSTNMPSLIGPPTDGLAGALTVLEPGERWLLEPRSLDETTWTPGIKDGVAPGSSFHVTECFGPVLGLMPAASVAEAVLLQNATGFGLTGGIHTLEPSEVDEWLDGVEVGNAYVNRRITGAIVARQPFGGWKRSSVGPGLKAGGPNYLLQLGTWHRGDDHLDESAWLERADRSDRHWCDVAYGVERDRAGLFCESNVLRYLPRPSVVVRVSADAEAPHVRRTVAAALRAGTSPLISTAPGAPPAPRGARVVEESDAALAERLKADLRVRTVGTTPLGVAAAAARCGADLIDDPVVSNGRIEMLWYLREQAVSTTLHRFGNVVGRR